MENENIELQRCPNCDSDSIKLNKNKTGFWYQCDMCWTGGKKGITKEEAAENWNAVKHLQNCPNCGSELVKLHRSRTRFWYECDGDCWTQSKKCLTIEDAAKSWNEIEQKPKQTNSEVMRDMDDEHLAVMLFWIRNHFDWVQDEYEMQKWLESEADEEVLRIAELNI